MKTAPVPVILFSTHSKEGAYSTFKALALGAVDFVAKPTDAAVGHLDTIADELIEKIKVAKRAAGRRLAPGQLPAAHLSSSKKTCLPAVPPNRIIAIGISTGGPNALQFLLSQIPADFPCLDPDRATHARRIYRNVCQTPGRMLPSDRSRSQIRRSASRRPRTDMPRQPPHDGATNASRRHGGTYGCATRERPSTICRRVVSFSVAQEFGLIAVGILMTGMGEDGAGRSRCNQGRRRHDHRAKRRKLRRQRHAARCYHQRIRQQNCAAGWNGCLFISHFGSERVSGENEGQTRKRTKKRKQFQFLHSAA